MFVRIAISARTSTLNPSAPKRDQRSSAATFASRFLLIPNLRRIYRHDPSFSCCRHCAPRRHRCNTCARRGIVRHDAWKPCRRTRTERRAGAPHRSTGCALHPSQIDKEINSHEPPHSPARVGRLVRRWWQRWRYRLSRHRQMWPTAQGQGNPMQALALQSGCRWPAQLLVRSLAART